MHTSASDRTLSGNTPLPRIQQPLCGLRTVIYCSRKPQFSVKTLQREKREDRFLASGVLWQGCQHLLDLWPKVFLLGISMLT